MWPARVLKGWRVSSGRNIQYFYIGVLRCDITIEI